MERVIVYPAPSLNQIIWVFTVVLASFFILALYHDMKNQEEKKQTFERLLTIEQNKNYDLKVKLRSMENQNK